MADEIIAQKPRRRWVRWLLGVPLALVTLLAVLMLDRSPTVLRPLPPSASQVRAAKALFAHVRRSAGISNPQPVAISWAEVASATNVANHLLGDRRLSISHSRGEIVAASSLPLPLGFWANSTWKVANSPDRFPPLSGKIGRLPIPGWLAPSLLSVGRWGAGKWGVHLPPPEKMIGGLAIADNGLLIHLARPKNAGQISSIVGAQLPPLGPGRLAAHYCAVAQSLKTQPVGDLPELIHRSFALSKGQDQAANRAALVVLPMLIVSRKIGELADAETKQTRDCAIPVLDVPLLGRPDLAKHWAMSAALTATIGAEVSGAMGTWKEISDSGSRGSGFSFVDIAADRSGIKFAQALIAEETSGAIRQQLSTVSAQDLLPLQALALAEGLNEDQFSKTYLSTTDKRYAEIIKRIDALLAARIKTGNSK